MIEMGIEPQGGMVLLEHIAELWCYALRHDDRGGSCADPDYLHVGGDRPQLAYDVL